MAYEIDDLSARSDGRRVPTDIFGSGFAKLSCHRAPAGRIVNIQIGGVGDIERDNPGRRPACLPFMRERTQDEARVMRIGQRGTHE